MMRKASRDFKMSSRVRGPVAGKESLDSRNHSSKARKPWRQTMNWEGGGEGAVERGVKSSLKKAHKPWIRGKKGAQTVN